MTKIILNCRIISKQLMKNKNCKCDCLNKKSHPAMISYLCPVCEIKRHGKLYCATCATCGICHRCKDLTPYPNIKYCTLCSIDLKCCEECGEKIKDGNTYIVA